MIMFAYEKTAVIPSPEMLYSRAFPPVNEEIISNIANVLRSNPNFYIQVLHLMSKMSLEVNQLSFCHDGFL